MFDFHVADLIFSRIRGRKEQRWNRGHIFLQKRFADSKTKQGRLRDASFFSETKPALDCG
jgi:hypothetical protein